MLEIIEKQLKEQKEIVKNNLKAQLKYEIFYFLSFYFDLFDLYF